MEQATTIGLDIAKYVFQVHGADSAGHVLFRKRITRGKLLGFLAAQAPCVVAMEACAGAHYWAREIAKSPMTDPNHNMIDAQEGFHFVDALRQRPKENRRHPGNSTWQSTVLV